MAVVNTSLMAMKGTSLLQWKPAERSTTFGEIKNMVVPTSRGGLQVKCMAQVTICYSKRTKSLERQFECIRDGESGDAKSMIRGGKTFVSWLAPTIHNSMMRDVRHLFLSWAHIFDAPRPHGIFSLHIYEGALCPKQWESRTLCIECLCLINPIIIAYWKLCPGPCNTPFWHFYLNYYYMLYLFDCETSSVWRHCGHMVLLFCRYIYICVCVMIDYGR